MILTLIFTVLVALIGSPTTAYFASKYFARRTESPLLTLSKRMNVFKINFIDLEKSDVDFDHEELDNFKYLIYSIFNTQRDVMDEGDFIQLRQRLINGISSLKLEFNDSRCHLALSEMLVEATDTYPKSEFPVVINMLVNTSLTLINRLR